VPSNSPSKRRAPLIEGCRKFVRAIQEDDEELLQGLARISRSRRLFAPLAFMIGAFASLLDGVRLLLGNWRLLLVEVLPAMWIWLAMFDLKLHVLHGRSFHMIRGAILIPIFLLIIAITIASFYLNAVFAFAIIQPGRPQIRPAFTQVRSHLGVVLGSGFVVGVCLGLSMAVVDRWGKFWFGLSLGAVIGVMMISYIAVPSRLTGVKTTRSRRDRLVASVVGITIGAIICTPPYILGRLGVLMLGSRVLFPLGVIFFAVGLTLGAGATGAVKAVRMSAKLVSRPKGPPNPDRPRSATRIPED
jgi:hypothetical protein